MTWRTNAACRGADSNLFIPDRGANGVAAVEKALAICATCTVRAECLEEALSRPELLGVWGGRTPTERRYLRKDHAHEHGTTTGYSRGCRCDACREAKRSWRTGRASGASRLGGH